MVFQRLLKICSIDSFYYFHSYFSELLLLWYFYCQNVKFPPRTLKKLYIATETHNYTEHGCCFGVLQRRQGQEHYTKLAAEHAQKTTIIITIHHHTIVIRKIYYLGTTYHFLLLLNGSSKIIKRFFNWFLLLFSFLFLKIIIIIMICFMVNIQNSHPEPSQTKTCIL